MRDSTKPFDLKDEEIYNDNKYTLHAIIVIIAKAKVGFELAKMIYSSRVGFGEFHTAQNNDLIFSRLSNIHISSLIIPRVVSRLLLMYMRIYLT